MSTLHEDLVASRATSGSTSTVDQDQKERKLKLVEVYNSVKGEGTQAGVPMTFVRFSKCNLSCTWCDTPYNRVAIDMTEGRLIEHIIDQKPAWVIFTGGEPTLQLKRSLTFELKKLDIKMAIETNGMIWTDAFEDLDYINISPKIGEPVDKRLAEHIIVDEVRYTLADGQNDIWNVLTGQPAGMPPKSLEPENSDAYSKWLGINTKAITISPLMKDPKPKVDFKSGDGFNEQYGEIDRASLAKCLHLVNKYRHYRARLSLQCHKFIGER